MGRPSKLTETQWDEVKRRRLAGESFGKLAMEFGLSKAAVIKQIGDRLVTVKTIANQMVSAEQDLRKLPVNDQILTVSYIDSVRAMQAGLSEGGIAGSRTFALLGVRAQRAAERLADDDKDGLAMVMALQRTANTAAEVPLALRNADKETLRELETGTAQSKDDLLREIAANLPN